MKWSDFEKYLKGEHLMGKKPIVVIEEVVIETTHPNGREEDKPVAYFASKQKGLILSPTNQRALRAMFGDDVTACRGKAIILEAVPMRVAGRDTLPIRIMPAPQPAAAAEPTVTRCEVCGQAEPIHAPSCRLKPTPESLNGWDDIEKLTPAADIKPSVPGK